MRALHLTVLPEEFSVWRLAADAPLPPVDSGSFLSMTRTNDELSIVSSSNNVPPGAKTETGWRCLRVEGPLAFEMTGVLAGLSVPLARAKVPIFVVSTYDTDYLMVKAADLNHACNTLRNEGHTVEI
ncbi:MAG: ACT domain-containing protein [Thermoanaerobaculales bacterium]|nr:ACT domain-containing protein [Thermoanaerobaculales bacterium]